MTLGEEKSEADKDIHFIFPSLDLSRITDKIISYTLSGNTRIPGMSVADIRTIKNTPNNRNPEYYKMKNRDVIHVFDVYHSTNITNSPTTIRDINPNLTNIPMLYNHLYYRTYNEIINGINVIDYNYKFTLKDDIDIVTFYENLVKGEYWVKHIENISYDSRIVSIYPDSFRKTLITNTGTSYNIATKPNEELGLLITNNSQYFGDYSGVEKPTIQFETINQVIKKQDYIDDPNVILNRKYEHFLFAKVKSPNYTGLDTHQYSYVYYPDYIRNILSPETQKPTFGSIANYTKFEYSNTSEDYELYDTALNNTNIGEMVNKTYLLTPDTRLRTLDNNTYSAWNLNPPNTDIIKGILLRNKPNRNTKTEPSVLIPGCDFSMNYKGAMTEMVGNPVLPYRGIEGAIATSDSIGFTDNYMRRAKYVDIYPYLFSFHRHPVYNHDLLGRNHECERMMLDSVRAKYSETAPIWLEHCYWQYNQHDFSTFNPYSPIVKALFNMTRYGIDTPAKQIHRLYGLHETLVFIRSFFTSLMSGGNLARVYLNISEGTLNPTSSGPVDKLYYSGLVCGKIEEISSNSEGSELYSYLNSAFTDKLSVFDQIQEDEHDILSDRLLGDDIDSTPDYLKFLFLYPIADKMEIQYDGGTYTFFNDSTIDKDHYKVGYIKQTYFGFNSISNSLATESFTSYNTHVENNTQDISSIKVSRNPQYQGKLPETLFTMGFNDADRWRSELTSEQGSISLIDKQFIDKHQLTDDQILSYLFCEFVTVFNAYRYDVASGNIIATGGSEEGVPVIIWQIPGRLQGLLARGLSRSYLTNFNFINRDPYENMQEYSDIIPALEHSELPRDYRESYMTYAEQFPGAVDRSSELRYMSRWFMEHSTFGSLFMMDYLHGDLVGKNIRVKLFVDKHKTDKSVAVNPNATKPVLEEYEFNIKGVTPFNRTPRTHTPD